MRHIGGRAGDWVNASIEGHLPERNATPDEAFELGKTAGWDEGYNAAQAARATRSHTATPTRCEHEPGCDCLTVPKGATWDQTVTVLTRRGCAALHRDGVGRVEVRQVEAGVRAALEGVARAKYVQDVIAALEKSGG